MKLRDNVSYQAGPLQSIYEIDGLLGIQAGDMLHGIRTPVHAVIQAAHGLADEKEWEAADGAIRVDSHCSPG